LGWLSGLAPLAILASAIAVFVALGAPGLERRGAPVEELAVERTVLRPGEIEVRVRNDGPDTVAVRQVVVNDRFTSFRQSTGSVGPLGSDRIVTEYPWIEGESYEVVLLTSVGGTIPVTIEAATATPSPDAGFFGLMALIGLYVGVIPVAIGMLWLPWLRQVGGGWIRFVMALTVGLLAFLAVDATLEGVELAAQGAQVFGGAGLVLLGAMTSYLALAGADAWVRRRAERARAGGADGFRLAFLIALGIGMHNLGEGLAIGAAYALGALALGATLVVGFALHNTTEGLAIVAPLAGRRSRPGRLVALGLLAGGPAILGAWIGASAYNPSLAAFLFGLGAGAIVQVIVQIGPRLRDSRGSLLNPLSTGGLLSGLAIMYVTGLLVAM
jgi:zinc transporter ZupT